MTTKVVFLNRADEDFPSAVAARKAVILEHPDVWFFVTACSTEAYITLDNKRRLVAVLFDLTQEEAPP